MYNALVHSSALLENVIIDARGQIDFLDERLGQNGRGVLDRRELKVKRGGKLVSICADSINLPPLEKLDGLVFAFITRRGTIMPFAQRLTPEQGVMAYLWGESTHSFATVPAKAGETVRRASWSGPITRSRRARAADHLAGQRPAASCLVSHRLGPGTRESLRMRHRA